MAKNSFLAEVAFMCGFTWAMNQLYVVKILFAWKY